MPVAVEEETLQVVEGLTVNAATNTAFLNLMPDKRPYRRRAFRLLWPSRHHDRLLHIIRTQGPGCVASLARMDLVLIVSCAACALSQLTKVATADGHSLFCSPLNPSHDRILPRIVLPTVIPHHWSNNGQKQPWQWPPLLCSMI